MDPEQKILDNWAKDNKIEHLLPWLIDDGFDTVKVLCGFEESDFKTLSTPIQKPGDRKKLLIAIEDLKKGPKAIAPSVVENDQMPPKPKAAKESPSKPEENPIEDCNGASVDRWENIHQRWEESEDKKAFLSNYQDEFKAMKVQMKPLVEEPKEDWGKYSAIAKFLEFIRKSRAAIRSDDAKGELIKQLKNYIKSVKEIEEKLSKIKWFAPLFPQGKLMVALVEQIWNFCEKLAIVEIAVDLLFSGLDTLLEEIEERLESVINESEQQKEEVNTALSGVMKELLKFFVTCGIGGTIAVTFVVTAIPLIGFTSAGIAAGSFAAYLMSLSGGAVASGSLVAILQSAGVVGLGAAATGGIFLVGGVIAGLGFGGYKLGTHLKKKAQEKKLLENKAKMDGNQA